MTEAKVTATDRRAVFVGAEAYGDAGGVILRDLFTEDGGGWFEDAALLDRLAAEKLTGIAQAVQDSEGWKWAEAHIDYPRALGLARVYPQPVERPEDERARMAALSEEYDALVSAWDAVETLLPEIEIRFAEIDAALEAFGDAKAFDAADVARGGVFAILGQDGMARIERGLIRSEDVPAAEGEADGESGERPSGGAAADTNEPDEDGGGPLSERLVLAANPTVALSAVAHSMALFAFFPAYDRPSCLEIKGVSTYPDSHAPGIDETRAGRSVAELLDLLAHCGVWPAKANPGAPMATA